MALHRQDHAAVDVYKRQITLWPFPVDAIEATIPQAKTYLSVEMNKKALTLGMDA